MRSTKKDRGENCLWQFARRLSEASYACYREIAGLPEVGRIPHPQPTIFLLILYLLFRFGYFGYSETILLFVKSLSVKLVRILSPVNRIYYWCNYFMNDLEARVVAVKSQNIKVEVNKAWKTDLT